MMEKQIQLRGPGGRGLPNITGEELSDNDRQDTPAGPRANGATEHGGSLRLCPSLHPARVSGTPGHTLFPKASDSHQG